MSYLISSTVVSDAGGEVEWRYIGSHSAVRAISRFNERFDAQGTSPKLLRNIPMEGIAPEAICDRANVSKRILDKHYNELTDEEAMELRREWFEDG